jgi:hypothetical protein
MRSGKLTISQGQKGKEREKGKNCINTEHEGRYPSKSKERNVSSSTAFREQQETSPLLYGRNIQKSTNLVQRVIEHFLYLTNAGL